MKTGSTLLLLVFSARCAFPQAGGEHFEVSSVKPSPAPASHRAFTIDGHGVDFGNIPMETIVETAFGLASYQIRGLPWFQDARFDILAQAPAGATREQIPAMLRALLVERFHLKSHIESNESDIYALAVGKEGSKMKLAAENPDKPDFGNRQVLQRIAYSSGPQFIVREPGRMTLESKKITMAELAQFLMAYVDFPVIDLTGLKDSYEVSLDVPGGTNYKTRGASAIPAGATQPAASDPAGEVSVVASVRKLGLVLERRKAPLQTLMVDSMDQTPKEN